MQFFFDGFDTVSVFITFVFYFLAVNPEVQDKAIAEVDEVVDKFGDEDNASGEVLSELKYLEQV